MGMGMPMGMGMGVGMESGSGGRGMLIGSRSIQGHQVMGSRCILHGRSRGRDAIGAQLGAIAQARLPVPHQHWDSHPTGRGQGGWMMRMGGVAMQQARMSLVALLVLGPLRLVAMVLEPDLHLRWGQSNQAGQVLPLRRTEVPLLAEPSLQLVGLSLREEHSALPLLVGQTIGSGAPAAATAIGIVHIVNVLLDAVLVQAVVVATAGTSASVQAVVLQAIVVIVVCGIVVVIVQGMGRRGSSRAGGAAMQRVAIEGIAHRQGIAVRRPAVALVVPGQGGRGLAIGANVGVGDLRGHWRGAIGTRRLLGAWKRRNNKGRLEKF